MSVCIYIDHGRCNLFSNDWSDAFCRAGRSDCPYKKPLSITNADVVRGKTDDELAEWFWWMLKYVQWYTDSRCALRDWLKREVKDGD